MVRTQDLSEHLRTWGEAGAVTLRAKMTPKVENRGHICMFVGYPDDHASDTYRMWDPRSRRVHVTRDIKWLNRMYFENPNLEFNIKNNPSLKFGEGANVRNIVNLEEGDNNATDSEEDIDTNDELEDNENLVNDDESKVSKKGSIDEITTRSGRKINKPFRYQDKSGGIGLDNWKEHALVGAGLLSDEGSTTSDLQSMKDDQAMKTLKKDQWLNAVEEECQRMIKNKVWELISKFKLQKNAKILTSTWAMKRKASGKFRSRINARGYEQIDGIHYSSDNTALPVTNDTTIKVVLVLVAIAGWMMHLVDVQGAFLIGRFGNEDELFIKVPQGFENNFNKDVVLNLNRTIYGLKQAASTFWSELLMALSDIGFTRSDADPCMYFKWGSNGLNLCLSWVMTVCS